ncbi:uncharacterized protein BP5553_04346 [Venustampulla echinocandica]|uniref:Poly A polymerase C-terminal region-like protein n=1 Tax=Venustampulla echinocandica TaxID=2656787 RepID=A0A370TWU8_9HELO|nr:uncharacterized protein BP5553_04346 [Venustampulla echinocandica]RDL40006.1 hypothetical protein BP5553_04346 [Venustampulla echinocandica]
MATTQILLTPQEQRLRLLLLDVAHFIDEAKLIQEKIELRFAGGWVRDKLLSIPSHDIDTAINSMTGFAFCEQMQKYLDNPKNIQKHALQKADLGSLHKIAANPEKSKHLETVTTRIFGFDVDFVNLRKEVYADDSRTPQMDFGTAEEDSLRRDATINALFYNLHSDQVEDLCGGLESLRAKCIRTPLEPLTTFTDDPLRVLRLIRFASRLGFTIDPDVEVAMTDPSVNEALKLKISRERVGVELEKMLTGNDPQGALYLIDRLGLYPFIFTDPTAPDFPVPSTVSWNFVYGLLQVLKVNETPGSIYHSLVRSDDAKYIAWILAALTPWSSVPLPERSATGKLPPPVAALIAREGIKANSKICDIVTGAFRNCGEITSLRDAIKLKDPYSQERDKLGMSIRRWDSQGKNWRLQVLLAIFVEALNGDGQSSYNELISEWQMFVIHLEEMDLMDAPSIKPLVNGNMLTKALGGIKPGIWMKPALDRCLEWQLRNPGDDDFEKAIEETYLIVACRGDLANIQTALSENRSLQVHDMRLQSRCSTPPTELLKNYSRAAVAMYGSIFLCPSNLLTSVAGLPERYSLSELYIELKPRDQKSSKKDTLENVLILTSCLGNPDRIMRESAEEDAINKLLLWVSKVILPDSGLIRQDEMPEDNEPASRQRALILTQHASTLGLQSLNLLITQIPSSPQKTLDPQILLSLIAFTNPSDPWTTQAASDTAHSLLSKYTAQTLTSDFIISFLLQSFIRPLYSKSKPTSITSAGRKAMPSSAPPKRFEAADLDRSSKPWKYEVVYSITIFKWAVENIPSTLISSSWHLFIPPLLTLLDDQSTHIRLSGIHILTHLLPYLTPKLLSQSGLDQVFEDALMPILLYLPNLTPPEESLQLLPAAYGALGVLCDVRYPPPPSHATPQTETTDEQQAQLEKEKVKLLDRILRKGIFAGYAHSCEHIPIVEELIRQLRVLISRLGIHTVKHLKDILPIILPSLSDPFTPSSSPSLLLSCILALQTTVLNTWPRLGVEKYRMEVIKVIAVGWKNTTDAVVDEKDGVRKEGLETVKKELKVLGRLFVKAVEAGDGGEEVNGEVATLVAEVQGMGMEELFGV